MKQADAVLYQDRLAREQERIKQEVEFSRFTSGGFVDNAKGH